MSGSPLVTLIEAFWPGLSGTRHRPRRLRFTWSCSDWADPAVQSLVTVSLEACGESETMMTIEHEQLPPEQVDSHQHGWGAIAAQFAEALGGRSV